MIWGCYPLGTGKKIKAVYTKQEGGPSVEASGEFETCICGKQFIIFEPVTFPRKWEELE